MLGGSAYPKVSTGVLEARWSQGHAGVLVLSKGKYGYSEKPLVTGVLRGARLILW
jgi:hypothetical protein